LENEKVRSMFAVAKKLCSGALLSLASIILVACTTIDTAPTANFALGDRWVMLPFANATETPLAGQRAEAVAMGLVQSMGLSDIQAYPQNLQDENLFEAGQGRTQEQSLAWARTQQARYALTGTVQEWRYKVGVDGEPVVGVVLQVIDLSDGRIAWSAVGAKSGWSRESLAAVAQKLIKSMLQPAFGRH